jgi:hypothetical protein
VLALYSGRRITGASDRQQTPKSCRSQNHGLWANASSCLRLAAEMSLALSGLISGASNISCSCSISSMMRSTSIPSQYLTERRRGQFGVASRKTATARFPVDPPATTYHRYQHPKGKVQMVFERNHASAVP